MSNDICRGAVTQPNGKPTSALGQGVDYREIFNPQPKGEYVLSNIYRRVTVNETSVSDMLEALRHPDYRYLFCPPTKKDAADTHANPR
jgi:hypothetical protein